MANKSRFSIAKSDIIEYFNESEKNIYNKDDLNQILSANRKYWRLTQNLTTEIFIDLLLDSTGLQKHRLEFSPREYVRYSWGDVDNLSLALSIRSIAYLSHYSALSYHGLTEQIPKTIYINVEQSKKATSPQTLTQSKIDNALSNPTRLSGNSIIYRDQTIYLLNGMNTELLGIDSDNESHFRYTNIERTLIDITVRPEYSGGIYEVVKAYGNAHDAVSINKLVSYLKRLNFLYPYHQCIGFYMAASGRYRESQLQLLRKLEMPLTFYLTHNIEQKVFSKEWNLYYPSNFQY